MEECVFVQQMQDGSREAFDQIYELYQNRIFRMAYLIVGNREDSEDIVQETFVKCFLHCRELKDSSMFRPWLFQILTRTAWQYGKKHRHEQPDEDIQEKAERSTDVTTLDQIVREEESTEIWNAVLKLDLKYRIVIVYYYYNEMSTREIARACECLEGTVKSRLFTARKQLKIKLKSMEGKEHSFYEREAGLGTENQFGYVR